MKKKIYIFNKISRSTNYGIGTYMKQLITCLKNVGVEFGVVSLYGKNGEVQISEENGYTDIEIPAPPRLKTPKDHVKYAQSVAYILRDIIPAEEKASHIFHFNFMGEPTLVATLKKNFKCKAILVAHYTEWSFELLGDTKKLQKICTERRNRLSKEELLIRDSVEKDKSMIKKCDHLVCVAKHTLSSFKQVFTVNTITSVIPNSLDNSFNPLTEAEKARIRRKYFVDENSKMILFAGRLEEVKGISSLISAFKIVAKKHDNAKLFIAGDGDYKRWLSEIDGYWNKVVFMGRLEQDQLREFYSIADIGIVCSIHEEFGYVALEMMMHRIPLIASDTGGLTDIVEDNITGFKVPVRLRGGKRKTCEKTMADKIDYLLANPDIASEVAKSGQAKFMSYYDLSIFGRNMLNLYQNI